MIGQQPRVPAPGPARWCARRTPSRCPPTRQSWCVAATFSVSLASSGGAADHVGGAVQHRAGQPGSKWAPGHLRPGSASASQSAVGSVDRRRSAPIPDKSSARPVSGAPSLSGSIAQRWKSRHQSADLVDGRHPQRRKAPSARDPAWLSSASAQPPPVRVNKLSPITGKRWNDQPAVEQVGLHPLGAPASSARSPRRTPARGCAKRRGAPVTACRQLARRVRAATDRRRSTGERPRRRPSESSTVPSRRPGRPRGSSKYGPLTGSHVAH